MRYEYWLLLLVFVGFAVVESLKTGFLHKKGQRAADAIVESVSAVVLLGMTTPLVLLCGGLVTAWAFPDQRDVLTDSPILLQVGLLLLLDDLTQYWWHRTCHNTRWLYNLHRAHHDAAYMSVRIVYRNSILYYLMMPGLWLSGGLIYLGLGRVYLVYIVVKLLVIVAAHSDVRWDAPLYRSPLLARFMWLVERIISTPATHAAHHGKHASDGVTNYKGNYGNLLFFWDILFGTAKITRRYPESFGVENLEPASAAQQLLWPLARDRSAPRPAARRRAARSANIVK